MARGKYQTSLYNLLFSEVKWNGMVYRTSCLSYPPPLVSFQWPFTTINQAWKIYLCRMSVYSKTEIWIHILSYCHWKTKWWEYQLSRSCGQTAATTTFTLGNSWANWLYRFLPFLSPLTELPSTFVTSQLGVSLIEFTHVLWSQQSRKYFNIQ